jgi:dienelactone hydrolase
MPLVIALPFITTWNQPFLESYYVAAFDEAERYRILGDDYGFAVVQLWGRGNYLGGTAIGTADVFDTLRAIRKDYKIDPDRLYLLGYCEAGRIALLLGERFPERFAAIATVAPITVEYRRRPYAARWTQYASPLNSVSSLKNVPVVIRHDEDDAPPPFQESELFIARSKEAGVEASLVRPEGGLHGFSQNPMGEKRELFEFFRGKKRRSSNLTDATNAMSAFGVGRGPIEDAFGAPILIVEGTRGSTAQRAAVHSLVEQISEKWREAYYVDCPVKRDSQVQDSDMQQYNLVIVGDEVTNSLAERMAERSPLRLTEDGISIAGRNYPGRRLGYEFIAPNPFNRAKYIVMIGMREWQLVNGWKPHPSRDGICDFFVFDLQGASPQLRDAGYFGASVWQESKPNNSARPSETPSSTKPAK